MTPPAASAAARVNAGNRSRQRRAGHAAATNKRSPWGLAGWLIGSIFWWLVWWPLRTVAGLLWALVRWIVRRPLRAAVAVLAVAALLGSAYTFWFRNSSWVLVDHIRVEGTTTQIDDINTAIASAAAGMTTLNADAGALKDALARFPTVRGVEVESDFPHGLVVHIDEMPPVALVATGDRLLPVAGDGRLLEGISASSLNLPTIQADSLPASGLLDGEPLEQAQVLGAAPPELRPLAEESSFASGGVVIRMRGGIELRFGPADDLADKWTAAAAVLADPKLDTASYVDLRIPSRPAVGGDPTAVAEPSTSALAGTETTTTATTTATTTTPATPVTGSTAAVPDPASTVAPGTSPGTSTSSTGAVSP